jgi:hypothetical protein
MLCRPYFSASMRWCERAGRSMAWER